MMTSFMHGVENETGEEEAIGSGGWKVGTVQNRHARTCPATTETGH
jgi:hypothetical protein